MPELRDEERKVLLGFASRVERNDPGALNNLGVVYFRKGMYEEAMEQFKEALKVDPKFDLARENLQYVFAETGLEDARGNLGAAGEARGRGHPASSASSSSPTVAASSSTRRGSPGNNDGSVGGRRTSATVRRPPPRSRPT